MAITKTKLKQLENSTTVGSIATTDTSNILKYVAPPASSILWGYDHGETATVPVTIGTNLTYDAGTNTLNASAGAGGYSEIQEETTPQTTRTKLAFIGSGLTAADDAGNTRTTVTLNSFLNTLATAGVVTLSGTDVTGTLPVAKGGTGLTAGTSGGILAYTAAGTISSSALLTANAIVLGGGAGVVPSTPLGLGTSAQVLHGNAGGAPTWGAVSLTADISGILPVANGGTGTSSGSITGTGALTFTAGGTNTNVTLAPNGTGSVDVSSKKIINLADPTNAQDGATKFYVDSQIQGLNPKARVRAATTAAGTLATSFANTQVIDGITLATNDRILIKNQVAPAENGIYIVQASGAPARATDMDVWAEVISAYVLVEVGSTLADTGWLCTSDAGGTLNTTAINWVQFSAAGIVTATNGLTKTANDIALGGTLSTSPTITGSSTFFLTINGSRVGAANASLEVLNSGTTGPGTKSTASGSGAGIWGISSSGTGAYGSSTTGIGIGGYTTSTSAGAALLQVDAANGNNALPVIIIDRINSGGAGADGIGSIISFRAETSTTLSQESNAIVSSWTTAAHATRQSTLQFTGQDSAATNNLFTLLGTGRATLNMYGVGTFTGTAAKNLQVTSAGVIIETPVLSVTRAYKTTSTASVFTLNSGTDVTDKDGANITFSTSGLSADQIVVVLNGIVLSESGTVSRDYTLNTGTSVLTLASALVSTDQLMIYKIV